MAPGGGEPGWQPSSPQARYVRADFKRDVDALASVFEFTDKFAGRNQLADSVVFSMNLAVEELFTNIVKYGARNDKDIGIDLAVHEGHLVIEVTDDDAEPFDITAAGEVDVTRSLAERKEGGLGIHLIRSIMDYVKYEYSDRRARVVLKKRLDPEESNV